MRRSIFYAISGDDHCMTGILIKYNRASVRCWLSTYRVLYSVMRLGQSQTSVSRRRGCEGRVAGEGATRSITSGRCENGSGGRTRRRNRGKASQDARLDRTVLRFRGPGARPSVRARRTIERGEEWRPMA